MVSLQGFLMVVSVMASFLDPPQRGPSEDFSVFPVSDVLPLWSLAVLF